MNNTRQTICKTKIWDLYKCKYNYTKTKHFSENKLYIYKFILDNEGVYLRQIYKEIGLAMGNIQYHLKILEKEGLIKHRIIGNRKHYYTMAISDERNEIILALVRQKVIRDILVYLIEYPGSYQKNLAKYMNLSAPTIKWHINRLIESHVIINIRKGMNIKYYIKDFTVLLSFLNDPFPSLSNGLIKNKK